MKPKKMIAQYTVPVKITGTGRKEILGLLGYDEKEKIVQSELLHELELKLQNHLDLLRKFSDRPLPAHILAELAPIILHGEHLAKCLQPGLITDETKHLLTGDIKSLWYSLINLIENAKAERRKIPADSRSDGGERNKIYFKLCKNIDAELTAFFDANAEIERKEDQSDLLKEFLEQCYKFMPPRPNRKKRLAKTNPL
jgi:hypothetical protein